VRVVENTAVTQNKTEIPKSQKGLETLYDKQVTKIKIRLTADDDKTTSTDPNFCIDSQRHFEVHP
jgi:hypothetical protein